MGQFLYQWDLNLTTWVYLSSLLTIAIYFKFGRLWSMRNLDLLVLIALAPGLLMIEHFGDVKYWGYVWLFVVGGVLLVRLLFDPRMVRRPLLEPNLSTSGMSFIAASLLVFLTVNVVTKRPTQEDLAGPRAFDLLIKGETPPEDTSLALHGPMYPLLYLIPSISTKPMFPKNPAVSEEQGRYRDHAATARTLAILLHLAVVIGIVVIGSRHFDNIRTGIAAATLYLLLPYTAQMTGHVYHVLPAALLTWAVAAYRRPLLSGMLLGLTSGAIYYPIFLLPLWLGFYWQRGLLRFMAGFAAMLALLVAVLVFTSSSMEQFLTQAKVMIGWTRLSAGVGEGFWSFGDTTYLPYRIPVLAAYIAMCGGFALWPTPKNLGTLLSCSAAVMLGTQFWHVQGGGVYVAWYLPLLLLTVFRPNLEDRIALATLGESWFWRRRLTLRKQAA